MKKKLVGLTLLLLFQLPFSTNSFAQQVDTIQHTFNSTILKPSSLILPGAMILYGVWATENTSLKKINNNIKDQIYVNNPHGKVHIDDYFQYTPAAIALGLSCVGIKGKDNTRDIAMIYLMSNVILNATVTTLKHTTHQLRPDGSAYNSFPSGHTTEAFASAELLRIEYKDRSPWLGIVGYSIAAATGYLRMYNNKHWFSDVVSGAGIGIASTKIAYWLYSKVEPKLFKHKKRNTFVVPTYHQGNIGLSISYRVN